MHVNDDAGHLMPRNVLGFIASRIAPTQSGIFEFIVSRLTPALRPLVREAVRPEESAHLAR
jgi:hypothetical protein